jgi:uracil-DNA glycosylase
MSSEYSPHILDSKNPREEKVRQYLDAISVCRQSPCPVPDKHWFYPIPDRSPFYHGKRPCMPVVPTRVVPGKVMILGAYPTCRFATIDSEKFVPVKDIDEPFENSRYFDNHNVRDVRSGDVLYECYLNFLGLDAVKDLWITNMVKCFLFKPGHINAYRRLGWTDPNVEPTRYEYLKVAAVCMTRHLAKELDLCQPKLVITLGAEVCRMVHSGKHGSPLAPYDRFEKVIGQPLRANELDSPDDTRNELFKDKNVFHMFHPGFLMREDDPEISEENKGKIERHYTEHIPSARKFLVELGLAGATMLGKPVDRAGVNAVKPYVDLDHAKGMR